MLPASAPRTAAIASSGRTACHPKYVPAKANRYTSPSPIAESIALLYPKRIGFGNKQEHSICIRFWSSCRNQFPLSIAVCACFICLTNMKLPSQYKSKPMAAPKRAPPKESTRLSIQLPRGIATAKNQPIMMTLRQRRVGTSICCQSMAAIKIKAEIKTRLGIVETICIIVVVAGSAVRNQSRHQRMLVSATIVKETSLALSSLPIGAAFGDPVQPACAISVSKQR